MQASCLQRLEDRALRRTEHRAALLELLHAAAGPLTVPALVTACHRNGRPVNKTTVYRDLSMMEQAGIVRRIMLSDRTQFFELTERGHHHHLVCTECDTIQDIPLRDTPLLRQAKLVSDGLGFVITSHSLEFFGRCSACLRRLGPAAI